MDMRNCELWLMVKDTRTKRIKAHIEFDIADYVQSQIDDVYVYVREAIKFACKRIDEKHLSMLRKGMEYDLAGIEECRSGDRFDAPELKQMLYSFENGLSKLVEYVNKSLDDDSLEVGDLAVTVSGVFWARKILSEFSEVPYHTDQQQIFIDMDIVSMAEKFIAKVKAEEKGHENAIMLATFTLPRSLACLFSMDKHEHLNKLRKIRIRLDHNPD